MFKNNPIWVAAIVFSAALSFDVHSEPGIIFDTSKIGKPDGRPTNLDKLRREQEEKRLADEDAKRKRDEAEKERDRMAKQECAESATARRDTCVRVSMSQWQGSPPPISLETCNERMLKEQRRCAGK